MNSEGQIYVADITGKNTAKSVAEACRKTRMNFRTLKLIEKSHIAGE
jgi:hypothetical protein